MKLQGATALVSGANRGIGKAFVEELARRGVTKIYAAVRDVDSLKGLKWGAVATTTALPILNDVIQPDSDPLLYNDNADVNAAIMAGQIDAALYDLPTALYLSAVVVEGGALLGQFPPEQSERPDQFGLLMEDGNPLKECVDAAITELTESGELAAIEAEWLAEATGVPVIE